MSNSTKEERLTYLELLPKVKTWPFTRFFVPMMIDVKIADDVLRILTFFGLNYDDWTSIGDVERCLLVDMDMASMHILEVFDPAFVYFQTPDRLVSC
jgi:hypothetical protein